MLSKLQRDGFVVLPNVLDSQRAAELAEAYDDAIARAISPEIRIGSTTTRVSDFVNRGPEFDSIYLHPPLLKACEQIICQPFKLSTLHGRTLHAHAPAQRLHIDFPSDAQGWSMVGFILMIDAFTAENGATLFLPGSQGLPELPEKLQLVPACGGAGSMILFNGSVWHGHGANTTDKPRRSLQGAYIRRSESSSTDFPARMRPETLERLSPFAKYLLAISSATYTESKFRDADSQLATGE